MVVNSSSNEALRREVINLVGANSRDHLVEAGVAFQGSAVEFDPADQMADAEEAVLGIFDRHPPRDAVYFVALVQQ